MLIRTLTTCRIALRRFSRREDGNVALEAIIIVPILFWAYMALFVIFDAYRQHSVNQKAAYTIGDLISRQTDAIDLSFLNGTRSLFDSLARSDVESSVRVTSVEYDEDNLEYLRDWSQSVGSMPPATDAQVLGWDVLLPIMPDNESITVVETWTRYIPPFNIGIGERDIYNFIFTRPRYAPNITFN